MTDTGWLAVLGVACLAFWIGIPLGILWALGRALPAVTGVLARLAEDEESGWQRRVRGPLEPLLLAPFLVALVALFVWLFVFAENPSSQVI